MEWLLPLLEDVRLNANQRGIMQCSAIISQNWRSRCKGRFVRCAERILSADIRGHCKVEIPVTRFCVINLPDVVNRVSGSIGIHERNR